MIKEIIIIFFVWGVGLIGYYIFYFKIRDMIRFRKEKKQILSYSYLNDLSGEDREREMIKSGLSSYALSKLLRGETNDSRKESSKLFKEKNGRFETKTRVRRNRERYF